MKEIASSLKIILARSLAVSLIVLLSGCGGGSSGSSGGANSSGAYTIVMKLDAQIKTFSGYVMGYPVFTWTGTS